MSTFCPACGVSLKELKNFCPECGSSLKAKVKSSAKGAIALALLSLVVWWSSWETKGSLQGIKPSARQEDLEESLSKADDSALASLRDSLKEDPKNLEKLKGLGEGLASKLLASDGKDSATVFELISVLDQILEIAPEDSEALLNRANIAYNFHSYDKAEQYYARYLKLNPDDVLSRTAYASTLTLIEKFDAAEVELATVLKADPNSFSARANLYVNYIARGDTAKAEEAAKEALKVAPNEEAKAKLEDLIKRFSNPKEGEKFKRAAGQDADHSDHDHAAHDHSDGDAGHTHGSVPAAFASLDGYLKAHPITGPKYVGLEVDGNKKLSLKFRDFPMGSMPPMPKEKFLSGIREQIKAMPEGERPTAVQFLDEKSGDVMERF